MYRNACAIFVEPNNLIEQCVMRSWSGFRVQHPGKYEERQVKPARATNAIQTRPMALGSPMRADCRDCPERGAYPGDKRAKRGVGLIHA
jgi:hypothetical protein